jgi:hypothetical protein
MHKDIDNVANKPPTDSGPKSFLIKNLQKVLHKVSNNYKTENNEQDTIYLKVEENSGMRLSVDLNDR